MWEFGKRRTRLTRSASTWAGSDRPVPVGEVLRAAERLRRTAGEVAARLSELGFVVPEHVWPASFDADDVAIVSHGLDRQTPWLELADPVPFGHVLRAAATLHRSPVEAVTRLRRLGFVVLEHPWPAAVDEDDVRLVSVNIDGAPPWRDPADPVLARHLLEVAQQQEWSVTYTAARLTELGYTLPPGLRLTDGAVADAVDS
jgi:hypothetical protein